MESDFDFCARRAAEEFVAANRADTADQRKHHRQLAEQYADLVRAMMLSRRHGAHAPPPSSDAPLPKDPPSNAKAA